MVERDKQLLYHIRKNCRSIQKYHERFGDSFDIFIKDDAYRNAVSMCILQIGELAKGLSDEFIAESKEDVFWRPIKGMRDILAHNYIKADMEIIWDTSKDNVNDLLEKCNKYIEIAESNDSISN